jgi:hypothetical protein
MAYAAGEPRTNETNIDENAIVKLSTNPFDAPRPSESG